MRLRGKVLLVEDDPHLQAELHDALTNEAGLEVVHTAHTEPDAAAWLDNEDAWDLAVIDIFLRDGHGFDVLRRCARRGGGRRAVILSNYTREPVRASAARLGADAVFDK